MYYFWGNVIILCLCPSLFCGGGGKIMVFGTFQGMEWVLIFLIILLIFGPSKLPQLARGLGQAIYEFRKASQGLTESKREQEGKRSLEGVDEETLRKLAEKLGIKDADKKERDDLIAEIISEAKKKGLLEEIKIKTSDTE
jgi:sec-independent protein translocase protein TatA